MRANLLPMTSITLATRPIPDLLVALPARRAAAVPPLLSVLAILLLSASGCQDSGNSTGSGGRPGSGPGGGNNTGGQGGSTSGGANGSGGETNSGGQGGASGGQTGSGGQGGASGGQTGSGGQGGASANGGGFGGAGTLVWTDDATKVVAEDRGGGFTGPPPTGSTCGLGVASYTFTAADNRLAWHVCTTGTVFTYTDGARALNNTERASLVTALRAVTISASTTCGADKSTRVITVTRPAGDATYFDSFYSCQHPGASVDGIDGVINVASMLSK